MAVRQLEAVADQRAERLEAGLHVVVAGAKVALHSLERAAGPSSHSRCSIAWPSIVPVYPRKKARPVALSAWSRGSEGKTVSAATVTQSRSTFEVLSQTSQEEALEDVREFELFGYFFS